MAEKSKHYQDDGLHSSLKTILHSKRANIFYLEHCRVMQKDGRVLYLTEARDENQFWNIPIANTTCILLGTGTSITQAAMRMLAAAGVLVGFCGGGGTPLLMANEVEWLTPQSEYRPTEYLQGWLSWWFDDSARLRAAKAFQQVRIDYLRKVWTRSRDLNSYGFNANDDPIRSLLDRQQQDIDTQTDVSHLLQCEARLTKQLYKHAATCTGHSGFTRDHDGLDLANGFLNHGNYLAYGLGATTAWVLGIPHGFAVMHGKTRRGALVFDIADLIKDALILPYAFICANEGDDEQTFRQQCLNAFTEHKALDVMFDTVKSLALANKEAP
ncbi:type I-F CRISPR-associated endonuclease Cas1f [Cardiobacteriaceae bacterium TAE3-ERU3]|nr:type I-F CRISPR-associated endonuclease Cas1f [Cardiobacteriaceae bacterium TAE3-ERU3]